MGSAIAIQCGVVLGARQGDAGARCQQALAETLGRLRRAFAGRQKAALAGVSRQYVSRTLHTGVMSLARFVEILSRLDEQQAAAVLRGLLMAAHDPELGEPMQHLAQSVTSHAQFTQQLVEVVRGGGCTPRDLEMLDAYAAQAQREISYARKAARGRV